MDRNDPPPSDRCLRCGGDRESDIAREVRRERGTFAQAKTLAAVSTGIARYPVSKYDSGAKPWKPLQFANKRAEEHWGLRTKLERHELAIPFDLALWDELLAVRWSENEKGQVQIESKDSVRNTLGRSPDRLDALVMALPSRTFGGGPIRTDLMW